MILVFGQKECINTRLVISTHAADQSIFWELRAISGSRGTATNNKGKSPPILKGVSLYWEYRIDTQITFVHEMKWYTQEKDEVGERRTYCTGMQLIQHLGRILGSKALFCWRKLECWDFLFCLKLCSLWSFWKAEWKRTTSSCTCGEQWGVNPRVSEVH